jgi:enamine deaminase RidA (YjgF/YER057c/UK114 family)
LSLAISASEDNTLYLSGQIGLDPYSMELVEGIEAQIRRVFDNDLAGHLVLLD